MTTPSTTPEGKDGIQNPQTVKIKNIASIFGGGNPIIHLRPGFNDKYTPQYFTYRPISLESLQEQVKSYEFEPKEFNSAQAAADFIRDNSFLVSDIYVLNPPGSTKFFVYQLDTIRNLKGALDGVLFKKNILEILDDRDFRRGPDDQLGLGKPEYTGSDDTGRPVPKLNANQLPERLSMLGAGPIVPLFGTEGQYIDTSSMHDLSRLKK